MLQQGAKAGAVSNVSARQGTNAHVAVEVAGARFEQPLFPAASTPWRRDRYWFCPQPHAFLKSWRLRDSGFGEQEILLHGLLTQRPASKFLWDLAVNSCRVLPPVAALEVSITCVNGCTDIDNRRSAQVARRVKVLPSVGCHSNSGYLDSWRGFAAPESSTYARLMRHRSSSAIPSGVDAARLSYQHSRWPDLSFGRN